MSTTSAICMLKGNYCFKARLSMTIMSLSVHTSPSKVGVAAQNSIKCIMFVNHIFQLFVFSKQ